MKLYRAYLLPGGLLLLSGFYTEDIPDLLHTAVPLGLTEVNRDERENWAALLLAVSNEQQAMISDRSADDCFG